MGQGLTSRLTVAAGGPPASVPATNLDRVRSWQFGGVQNALYRPLNIDFLHAKGGRGIDRWWPRHYQIWHGKRYLAPVDVFHQLAPDEIPVEATQRQTPPHPQRSQVADVPDNRRPGRRMMVATGTTARHRQSLDEIMVEDGRSRFPINAFGGWERAVDGGGGGEAVEAVERAVTTDNAPTHHAHEAGTSTQAEVPATPSDSADCGHIDHCPSSRALLDGLSSPGLQQMIEQILLPGEDYMLDFDGIEFDGSQVHSDLNEPVSTPSQSFMELGNTPPSTHARSFMGDAILGACSCSDDAF
ncbi:hypothetical protein PIB30_030494 [Stylosanthes scabra]|uniref:Uncharacterized protein n=1 Tax=Stylosanthes scabra TaxID=79078 RepID=A0ABU6WF51_9FABA|nr:hypothetical protein [Stylosanthes scabra]